MNLTREGLKNREGFLQAGYRLPAYDLETVWAKTKEAPFWLHFGTGNIFRAFQANVVQNLLNEGIIDRGLIAVSGSNPEIIEKIYRPHDNLSVLVTLKADGTMEKTVIGSIAQSVIASSALQEEYARLKEIFRRDSLQMVSYTITEKGYALTDTKGNLKEDVKKDLEAGPAAPVSYMGLSAALLYERYLAGELPVAMVSMDNCSHNGDVLKQSMMTFAKSWEEANLVKKGFVKYLSKDEKVSFPWTMIDKITPRPDKQVQEMLEKDGIDDLKMAVTSKGTYASPFVNAEECEYLVIEDHFPNGRPKLETGGILFTDRETVDQVEKMKVCTCLNPLHTALAVFGCLLGYEKISDEMKDPELKQLVRIIGYEEGLPAVVNPGVLDPKEFIDTVVNIRIPNPFMPDTPQRIATDTSQKLAIRFGETIKTYETRENLDIQNLKRIPLVLAGWLRYLMAVDDEGKAFELSPDPLLSVVCPYAEQLKLEPGQNTEAVIGPVLKMKHIFGVDLYEAGLAELVCGYLKEMTAGPGAVRATLRKYV